MHIDLSSKRVIVTGASRGIGRAITEAFAREGARVAICARDGTALAEAADALTNVRAQDVIATPTDVKDTDGVRAFVAEVATAWGGIDVLVNNAGQGMGGQVDTVEPEALLAHADLTQVSHYRFSQAVIPHMRARRWGRIIDINAMSGVFPGLGSPRRSTARRAWR